MKTSKFLFLAFTLFIQLIFFSTVRAQSIYSGFIITNEADTVYGNISIRSNVSNAKECKFQASEVAEWKTYQPTEIKAYVVPQNKYYVSQQVSIDSVQQTVFIEFLLKGIAELYYLNHEGDEKYFLQSNGDFIELADAYDLYLADGTKVDKYTAEMSKANFFQRRASNHYHYTLKYAFKDNPEIFQKIEEARFSHRDLIQLTEAYHYNVCEDPSFECIDYTKLGKQIIWIEPYVGYSQAQMKLNDEIDSPPDAFNSPLFGVNVRLIPTFFNETINLNLGMDFSSLEFYWEEINSGTVVSTRPETSIKYSLMRVPILFSYRFFNSRLTPYIKGGLVGGILLNVRTTSSQYDQNEYYTRLRNFNIGVLGGLGLKFEVNQSFSIFVESKYEFRRPSTSSFYWLDRASVNTMIHSFGLGYKLKRK